MSTQNQQNIETLAQQSAHSFFERGSKPNLMFALCDVLEISRDTVAEHLGISRGQINHYRDNRTDIPTERANHALKLIQSACSGLQQEIELHSKSAKTKNSVQSAIISVLEAKINLASQIRADYVAHQKKQLDEQYQSLQRATEKE
ncbi:MAG: hypothetical protein C0509_04140 [Acinetobacter sp.]|nr:hypothetical protein [Acinetobacter sp.]